MDNRGEPYNETTDLYQQMLWTARRMEDQKLVELILKRLKTGTESVVTTAAGCQVIAFPASCVHPRCISAAGDAQNWPRQPLLQTASILVGYGSLIAASLIFGFA